MNKYIHELNIGKVKVNNNIFLAPMAGISDISFRRIVRKFNPGLTFTEMVSSKALTFDSKKTKKLLELLPKERPSIVQIFGSSSKVICDTIKILNEIEEIDIIDINMGCPAPKIVKNGDGAGLLTNLENVEDIISSAVKISKKPITVKTRKGINGIITAIDVAKICEKYGVSMITIHGRTREEYYSGINDLDIIKKVKESVNIPVIASGDITDITSLNKVFDYTHCDGVMIGRGAIGNPWIFKSILDDTEYIVSYKERLDTILTHIDYILKDDIRGYLKLKKHVNWYLKGLKGATKYKDEINKTDDVEKIKELLIKYFNEELNY
ncbi:MAG: tRNA dihydrouridine synthase DusB [Clostridia bacterium]